MSRIDTLLGFLEDDPKDSFSRYALAMEYAKAGRVEDAIREYRTVVEKDPDYVATYYQLAKALEAEGQVEAARATYRSGIEVAERKGDAHTREELIAALELLGT